MRRTPAAIALLLAWVCAQGVLMDAVQVFAWGRMFTDYARVMSWSDALRETFDPNKPCELCCAVRKAREAEQTSPAPPLRDAPRIVLFCADADDQAPPLRERMKYSPDTVHATEWCVTVPTPPPRTPVS